MVNLVIRNWGGTCWGMVGDLKITSREIQWLISYAAIYPIVKWETFGVVVVALIYFALIFFSDWSPCVGCFGLVRSAMGYLSWDLSGCCTAWRPIDSWVVSFLLMHTSFLNLIAAVISPWCLLMLGLSKLQQDHVIGKYLLPMMLEYHLF